MVEAHATALNGLELFLSKHVHRNDEELVSHLTKMVFVSHKNCFFVTEKAPEVEMAHQLSRFATCYLSSLYLSVKVAMKLH